jgi:cell division protein ZapA (FtsZ GTPase activity inhibitor)
MGRELQVKSAASAELVRKIEAFVNEKLVEVEASVKGCDSQLVAILTLMNLGEAYLNLVRENESIRQQAEETVSRILQRLDENLA